MESLSFSLQSNSKDDVFSSILDLNYSSVRIASLLIFLVDMLYRKGSFDTSQLKGMDDSVCAKVILSFV